MFGIGAWSARRKAAAAALLALLLSVPMGISEQSQPVVTGHSTFYNGSGFDPCLASIAGILRTQVMWFNDQILAERYGGKGTYIYVTENGSFDPRPSDRNWLYTEGVFYDFVDPNGVHWHVDEAFMIVSTDTGQIIKGDPAKPDDFGVGVKQAQDRQYVWVVELSAFPIHDQFAGNPNPSDPNYHDLYNFLAIVDTCKFHRNDKTSLDPAGDRKPDGSYDYNLTHDGSVLQPNYGHQAGTEAHTHESFLADLWVGTKPVLLPFGADASGAQWESDWAMSGAQGSASNSYPGKPTNPVGGP